MYLLQNQYDYPSWVLINMKNITDLKTETLNSFLKNILAIMYFSFKCKVVHFKLIYLLIFLWKIIIMKQ
jgi:hypothetical protein